MVCTSTIGFECLTGSEGLNLVVLMTMAGIAAGVDEAGVRTMEGLSNRPHLRPSPPTHPLSTPPNGS